MNTVHRYTHPRTIGIACALALVWVTGAALATEPENMDRPAPTKEMREKMANLHEQMATCLRSERPISDCHAEMMQHHGMMMHHEMGEHEGMDRDDCMHKSGHDQAMNDQSTAKPDQK